jgi:O-antigen/teichoic acid export membrane protein
MKKSFLSIVLVGGGNVFNSVLAFFYLTAVAKILSLDDFGKYSLLLSILTFAAKGTDFGTNSLYVSKSIAKEDPKLDSHLITIKLFLLAVAAFVGPLVFLLLGINQLSLIGIFYLGLIAYGFSFYLQALFQKSEKYFYYLLTNSISALIKGGAAVFILFKIWSPNLEQSYLVFCLSMVPTVFLMVLAPKIKFSIKPDIRSSLNYFKEAIPGGISQLIQEGWPAINNAIAKLSSGFSDVGVFSLANKLSNIFAIISISIFTVLLPKNAIRRKNKEGYDFAETGIISVLVFLSAIVAIAISKNFLQFFFGSKFGGSIILLDILIFASAISAIHTFMENYFYVVQKINYILKINIFRICIFAILGIFLVTQKGLYGLALANLISSLLTLILITFQIRKLDRA